MKAGELISRLIQAGWVEVRQKGSHKTFKHPTNPQLVTVPIHGSKDLTLRHHPIDRANSWAAAQVMFRVEDRMARIAYWAVLEIGDDGGFGVFFPDLDGCITAGDSAAEAADNAREALSLHLEALEEAGEKPPRPRDLKEAKAKAERDEAANIEAFLLVEVENHAGERVNVYLPKSLLERVDTFASAAGMNRSSFFGLAAKRLLEQERGRSRA